MAGYHKPPREIHYELAPASDYRPVSIWKLFFAFLVAVFILLAILFALYIIWYVYLRPPPPPLNYVSDASPAPPATFRRVQHRKQLEVVVAHHDANAERADEVARRLERQLAALLDPNVYANLTVSRVASSLLRSYSRSDGRLTLELTLNRTARQPSGVLMVVSELFAPTGGVLWGATRADHRACSPLSEPNCVEICLVPLAAAGDASGNGDEVGQAGILSDPPPARVDYEVLDVRLTNLVDYAQMSAVYRQQDAKSFSLARRKKGCVPTY